MAAIEVRAALSQAESLCRRSRCVSARTPQYAEGAERRRRVLKFTVWVGAFVSASFGVLQLATNQSAWWIALLNLVVAAICLATPMLYRYGEIVGPLTFIGVAYATIFSIGWAIGTGSGVQLFFLVVAAATVLILGIEHIALAAVLAGIGVVLAIILQVLVPADTGLQPPWLLTTGFAFTITAGCLTLVATVWFTLRETARAEAAVEAEYERSEALLTNILPESIAARLKDPARTVIADKYDDAAILFTDIADFTENASDTNPVELVRFLDLLYTDFDRLVDKHRLEKVKTSGDSYMVVSGVPTPRPDHLEALASLALDMANTTATMTDPSGHPLRIRIGLAAGPVVAGVVGASRFFYDVWGDAVNVAARMESTDPEGRIQVPQNVYERLRHAFVFAERGDIEVKGKGVMHTWYLVDRRSDTPVNAVPATADVGDPAATVS